jgi:hypothetical protein
MLNLLGILIVIYLLIGIWVGYIAVNADKMPFVTITEHKGKFSDMTKWDKSVIFIRLTLFWVFHVNFTKENK